MLQLHMTARPIGAAEEYLPLEQLSLYAQTEIQSCTNAPEEPGQIRIRIRNDGDDLWQGVIRIALPVPEYARFYLPGFLYGTNRGEAPLVVDSPCPRLRKGGDFPAANWWMVRSDRLSHPIALAFADGRITGFTASPYWVEQDGCRRPWQPGAEGAFDQYAGFGCSILPGELIYTLGYENAPWMFIESHRHIQRQPLKDNVFALKAGETVEILLHCFDYAAADERGIHKALGYCYRLWHQAPSRPGTVQGTVRAIAGAIAKDAWLADKHTYSGFVYDRGDHFDYNPLPSISWTNGLSAAVPMLASACRLGDESMRLQALDCIDHIVAHSLNPGNSLPYMAEQDGVWSNRGWWYDRLRTPGHAAYLVGQSTYLILKAWDIEKRIKGIRHDDWLVFAQNVVARTETTRNTDGEYPYVFSERTGAGLEYDSFSGAWCMAAAAYLAHLTGDNTHLSGLLLSEEWYHRAYICRQECYGGPLDIDKNIDSEGILAYIRAVHYLHAITSDDKLLDHLKDALDYEFTFKFCYNSPIKVPPLSTTGWSSCGGSITSVVNPHVHPMSSSVIDEMFYYLSFREDAYMRSRMQDTIQWSCQCHNTFDREFGYGMTGWMSERFCHCEGLLKERYPDGSPASTWFALMPWACGSLLEGLTGQAWEWEG